MPIFLVFGYGIPKDILKDENYSIYLKTVFNRIYDLTSKDRLGKTYIILCGGETDMRKPYRRNEAAEMLRFFRTLIQKRPEIKSLTKKWKFILEKDSLSTLENMLNSKRIIGRKHIVNKDIQIFCEQTRTERIEFVARKIFGRKVRVIPVDFDVTANRYVPLDFLERKEKAEMSHSLWALRNPENLKRHHELFQEKIDFLRKEGPDKHVKAVREWWEKKLNEMS